MTSECRIDMLGGLRAWVEGRAITRFQTQKTGALLAYLAYHPGQTFHREHLAGLLWPDGDATAIRNRLNQAVSSLRRQLHPPGCEPNAVIVADHLTLAINERTVVTDVAQFRDLVRLADGTEEEADQIQHLSQAVSLYGGELLHGYDEAWIRLERIGIEDLLYDSLSRLIKLNVSAGRIQEAIEVAGRRLAQEPNNERSHRALMRLYILAGRPRSAVSQFGELRRILSRQGREPSARAHKLLEEAHAGIGVDAPITSIATSGDAGPGRHEEVADRLARLPTYLSPFFGREMELNQLGTLYADGPRLATLVGLGGTGKTRLAIEFAVRSGANAVFHPCGEATTIAEIEETLALRGDPQLLVLDEADSLHLSELARLSNTMASRGLRVLATGRRPLGLDGESVVPVGPLPTPQTSALVDLVQNDAIRLFVDRAQSVRQDFQLTERTAESISELCRRLEGWPLALELCASWARTMTPGQMVEQFVERSEDLASRRRDIAPKHRSLRAVLESTFQSLSLEAREALGRWAVFSAGWDATAAAALIPGQDVHHLLDEAVSSGLLLTEFQAERGVYRLLEPIRMFARNAVPLDVLEDARFRHAEYFRTRMAGLGAAQFSDFQWVEPEYANFLQSFQYFLGTENAEVVATFGADLATYWDLTERFVEGSIWMARAKPLALQAPTSDAALFLARYARLISHTSTDDASRCLDEAFDLFAQTDDVERTLETSFLRGHLAHQSGNFSEAHGLFTELVDSSSQYGLTFLEARAWLGKGNALVEAGEFDAAAHAYEQCLAIGDRIQNVYLSMGARGNIGNLLAIQGRLPAARAWLHEVIEMTDKADLRKLSVDARLTIARVERMAGNFEAAKHQIDQCCELGLQDRNHYEILLREVAALLAEQGQWGDAAAVLGQHDRLMRLVEIREMGFQQADLVDLRNRVIGALGAESFDAHFQQGASKVFDHAHNLLLQKTSVPA